MSLSVAVTMSLQREVPHLRPVSIPAINGVLGLLQAGAPVPRQPVRGLPIGNGKVQHLCGAGRLELIWSCCLPCYSSPEEKALPNLQTQMYKWQGSRRD